ncbi:MAG: hypothetical protein H6909_02390 [Rickettsiaceae bacterium]|nr:hypothetical protein [Rickettsiaceae bacterium]
MMKDWISKEEILDISTHLNQFKNIFKSRSRVLACPYKDAAEAHGGHIEVREAEPKAKIYCLAAEEVLG